MTQAAGALPAVPWRQLVDQQERVISRTQARHGGLSEDQWQWRLDTGRWQSVLHGVAVAHSGEVTERQRARAAVQFCGRTAHLTADAALVEHGMRLRAPAVLHVVVDPSREVTPQEFRRPDPLQPRYRVKAHRVSRIRRWAHPVEQPPLLHIAPAVLHAAAWADRHRAAERHHRVLLLRLTMGNLRHDGQRVALQLRRALL